MLYINIMFIAYLKGTFLRYKAFTLSEVMLVLSVIGVIAALTIPGIVQNMQNKQVLAKLKKEYSLVQQVINTAQIDFGPASTWQEWNTVDDGTIATQIINNYFLPYVSPLRNYGKSVGYSMCNYGSYHWLTGVGVSTPLTNLASIQLADGACIALNTNKALFIDVTGSSGPNIFGKDIFAFYLDSNSKIRPFGDTWTYAQITNSAVASSCADSYPSYVAGAGYTCSARIMLYDNWQINY